jgi:transcription-repair coupling factor (superfamily II helicase)
MILPFVRELFADVEKSTVFARAVARVKGGAGGIRVSGLTPTGKALFYCLLCRATARPLIVIVPDNRATDDLLPVVRSLGELTGALSAEQVVALPAYDVSPFENLSPHPEIQEARATALWKIVTGAVSIVITPVSATAMRLRDAAFYSDLARVVRRGEIVDPEQLIEHLRIVGYNQVDVVEMTGEFAHRGGLLDVYPPELDRPVRIELFGDEVESIRKFDPGTQRSAATTEEVVLLPLTETPVEETTLAAINARLVGDRLSGDEDVIAETVRSVGVAVFPGWELYAPIVGAKESIFDLMPGAVVLLDEPDALEEAQDAWWSKVSEAHERSLVGNLVRPEDLYLTRGEWGAHLQQAPAIAVEQLGIEATPDVANPAYNPLPRIGRGDDRGGRPARARGEESHLRRVEHWRSRTAG